MKKKVLLFFGTRPEAIKMAPVALALRESPFFTPEIGLSGQHKDLVDPILKFFGLKADFDLRISNHCENIEDPVATGLPQLCDILRTRNYDTIYVHGDTSTTLLGSLTGFYTQTPVAHVEAGLRSHSMDNPFPEEMNRKLTASLARYHFTATRKASANLISEGVDEASVFKTGNTVVDALRIGASKLIECRGAVHQIEQQLSTLSREKPWILLTIHRRENLNPTFIETVKNTLMLARTTGATILFPMHPNPIVRELLSQVPMESELIKVLHPLDYPEMVWLYQKLSLIVTDSGGIQEEAASFGIPTLVTREVTERNETVATGLTHLIGKNLSQILTEGQKRMRLPAEDRQLNHKTPYGDGYAAEKIRLIMEWQLNQRLNLKTPMALY